MQRGGSLAGVPNIYLIYWARLTDSPPSAPVDMTITVRCFEEDPYTVSVFVSDQIIDLTFDEWFAFQLRYDIETVNVHRSVNDPDFIYTVYSVPFSRSLEVIKALEELYINGGF